MFDVSFVADYCYVSAFRLDDFFLLAWLEMDKLEEGGGVYIVGKQFGAAHTIN